MRRWVRTEALIFSAALAALLVSPHFSAAQEVLTEATREFDAGNYRQATALLNTALEAPAAPNEKPPPAARLHYWLARCAYEVRDFDRAIKNLERAVGLEPGNSDYHLWLGRAYGRRAEVAGWFSGFSLARKTRRELEAAVRLDPTNFEAQHDLIEFYLEAPGIVGGGDEKARRQIEALAALDPAEAHLGRGDYWGKKKPEQAEAEYRQALEGQSRRVGLYLNVADFYQTRKDAARLEEAVEAAARLDAADRRLGYYRGVARILAGNRLQEAEKLLKDYLATVPQRSDFPSHSLAQEWLGHLYERQGKRDAAIVQYRLALESDPHNKTARDNLRRLQK